MVFGIIAAAVPAVLVWLFKAQSESWNQIILRGEVFVFSAPVLVGTVPALFSPRKDAQRVRAWLHAAWVTVGTTCLILIAFVNARSDRFPQEWVYSSSVITFLSCFVVGAAIVGISAWVDAKP